MCHWCFEDAQALLRFGFTAPEFVLPKRFLHSSSESQKHCCRRRLDRAFLPRHPRRRGGKPNTKYSSGLRSSENTVVPAAERPFEGSSAFSPLCLQHSECSPSALNSRYNGVHPIWISDSSEWGQVPRPGRDGVHVHQTTQIALSPHSEENDLHDTRPGVRFAA